METLASGYGLVEAPTVDEDGNLYFSDVLGGGVYRRAPGGDITTVVPKRRGVGGIVLHADGGIVVSGRDIVHVREGENRRLLAVDGVLGWNDICADSAGRVYARARTSYDKGDLDLVAPHSVGRAVVTGRPLVERIVAPMGVDLPVRKGQELGEVRVSERGKLVARSPQDLSSGAVKAASSAPAAAAAASVSLQAQQSPAAGVEQQPRVAAQARQQRVAIEPLLAERAVKTRRITFTGNAEANQAASQLEPAEQAAQAERAANEARRAIGPGGRLVYAARCTFGNQSGQVSGSAKASNTHARGAAMVASATCTDRARSASSAGSGIGTAASNAFV